MRIDNLCLVCSRTGVVYNVTPRGLGVELNKKVKGKILKKRICIRYEHAKPSACREDFLQRVKVNDVAKNLANKEQRKYSCRQRPSLFC